MSNDAYNPKDFVGYYRGCATVSQCASSFGNTYKHGQSKRHSVFESIFNVIVGFSVNFSANAFIFPLFGFNITAKQNIMFGVIYTVISLVRSYLLRRVFNRIMVRGK